MQTKKRKIAIFIASILLTVFGRSSLSLSFSVSPSKISSSYTTQSFLLPDIKVTNNDTESIDVSVSVLPLGQDSTGSAVEGYESYRYSIAQYIVIKLEERRFALNPGETFTIHPAVQLPKTYEEPNGFALIAVECATKSARLKATSSGVLSTGTIGVLVLLDFPKYKKNYEFKIENLTIEKRSTNEYRINAFVENTGNYLTEFKGDVKIKDLNGNTLASILLKPKSILPQHGVKLYATWLPESFPTEGFIIECTALSEIAKKEQKLVKSFKIDKNNQIIGINE